VRPQGLAGKESQEFKAVVQDSKGFDFAVKKFSSFIFNFPFQEAEQNSYFYLPGGPLFPQVFWLSHLP
ncbi:unnamed protein product, partial [marine sediment metagenome]